MPHSKITMPWTEKEIRKRSEKQHNWLPFEQLSVDEWHLRYMKKNKRWIQLKFDAHEVEGQFFPESTMDGAIIIVTEFENYQVGSKDKTN